MDGFKVFNPDWTSSFGDIVYEVGKTYRTAGEPELCKTGLHFCEDVIDCLSYRPLDFRNHVCRIRATGKIDKGNYEYGEHKACTNELVIIEELSWDEVFETIYADYPNFGIHLITRSTDSKNHGNSYDWGLLNEGSHNIGNRNAGSHNIGNSNSGDGNIGSANSGTSNSGNGNEGNGNAGSRNSGSRNAGSANAGARNAGNWNRGNFNAGSHNAGNRNVGDWNTGYGNHGCFCTEEHKQILMFDKPCDWTMSDWLHSREKRLLDELPQRYKEDTGCVSITPTDEAYRDYAQRWWSALPVTDITNILLLPNFDPAKFLEITGIDVYKRVSEAEALSPAPAVAEDDRPKFEGETEANTMLTLESFSAELESSL